MQISVFRFLCGKMGEKMKNQTELFRRKVFPGGVRRQPAKKGRKAPARENSGFACRKEQRGFRITVSYAGGRGLQRNGRAGP